MRGILDAYLDKLRVQGLADPRSALFLAIDDELIASRQMARDDEPLRQVIEGMSMASLLFAGPVEPYGSMLEEILASDVEYPVSGRIVPKDSETRTFLHDLPVLDVYSAAEISGALAKRRAVIVRGRGIVTSGAITPEQAYISFSSVCFSIFVKYFCDALFYLEDCTAGRAEPDKRRIAAFGRILDYIAAMPVHDEPLLADAALATDEEIVDRMAEAGRAVVSMGLVDSSFGNISYSHDRHIFISETGAALDELEGAIDKVPIDGSSSIGITASSELSAHKRIAQETGLRAILHGHPKFAVVLSLLCRKEGCDLSRCHTACSEKRIIAGAPVVPGEIGTGSTGLMTTVPAAMKVYSCAIVYGHGVFTAGSDDFRGPLSLLASIESCCRKEYIGRASDLISRVI